jgi:hypothetical protein
VRRFCGQSITARRTDAFCRKFFNQIGL